MWKVSNSDSAQPPYSRNQREEILGIKKKKQKEENWGNIYRRALPLLDDLLARNGWNTHEEKTSSGEEEWEDINIIRDTGKGMKPKQNLTWRMLLTWGRWKVKAGCPGCGRGFCFHLSEPTHPSHQRLIHPPPTPGHAKISKKSKLCETIQRRHAGLHPRGDKGIKMRWRFGMKKHELPVVR